MTLKTLPEQGRGPVGDKKKESSTPLPSPRLQDGSTDDEFTGIHSNSPTNAERKQIQRLRVTFDNDGDTTGVEDTRSQSTRMASRGTEERKQTMLQNITKKAAISASVDTAGEVIPPLEPCHEEEGIETHYSRRERILNPRLTNGQSITTPLALTRMLELNHRRQAPLHPNHHHYSRHKAGSTARAIINNSTGGHHNSTGTSSDERRTSKGRQTMKGWVRGSLPMEQLVQEIEYREAEAASFRTMYERERTKVRVCLSLHISIDIDCVQFHLNFSPLVCLLHCCFLSNSCCGLSEVREIF